MRLKEWTSIYAPIKPAEGPRNRSLFFCKVKGFKEMRWGQSEKWVLTRVLIENVLVLVSQSSPLRGSHDTNSSLRHMHKNTHSEPHIGSYANCKPSWSALIWSDLISHSLGCRESPTQSSNIYLAPVYARHNAGHEGKKQRWEKCGLYLVRILDLGMRQLTEKQGFHTFAFYLPHLVVNFSRKIGLRRVESTKVRLSGSIFQHYLLLLNDLGQYTFISVNQFLQP